MKEWAQIIAGAIGMVLLTAAFMLVTVVLPLVAVIWVIFLGIEQFIK